MSNKSVIIIRYDRLFEYRCTNEIDPFTFCMSMIYVLSELIDQCGIFFASL